MRTQRIPSSYRERIIQGENNWWFLGPGGIARLKATHLTEEGHLTSKAEEFLRDRGLFATKAPTVYSLTVLTSTDCNLGCGYCFQNTGQDQSGGSRPPRIAHSRLTSDTITDVLEFTKRQMDAVGLEKLSVLLFGGEPLLNFRGCRELLARAADYGLISAWMISNGTLLTPLMAKALEDLGLRSVQVTFDGDGAWHDLIRVRRSGGGTFDNIIGNMVAVTEATALRWKVRVNVSHRNESRMDTLIDSLAERLDPARCGIHFAWVGDVGVGYVNDLRHNSTLAEKFFNWRRRALEAGFSVGLPGASAPCQACSFADGQYGAVVSADGTLSSCWETAGKPGWQVGTAAAGYLPSEETRDRWISCADMYHYEDDDQKVRDWRDEVDATFLEYLDKAGRLSV